jgi:hypothetical protein
MKFTLSMVMIFISSFLVQYFFIPLITVNSLHDITNNIGKGYLAIIVALTRVIIEIVMKDNQYHVFSVNLYLLFIGLTVLFIYLYRKQIYVNDEQYIKSMIEQHSKNIFINEQILKKTDNYEVAKLAKNIISRQNDELRIMEELLVNKKL